MNSKTSSRSLINKKLFSNTLRRHWWFGFIVCLCFLFLNTMTLAFALHNYVEMQSDLQLARYLTGYFFSSSGVSNLSADMLAAMGFGVAAGLVFFGFLHNKRQSDFFHGQPTTRPTRLLTRCLTGAVLFAAGYMLPLLISFVLLLSYGASPAIFGQLLLRFVVIFLGFALLFALSVLSAVLTGNAFAHLQAGFMLCFAPYLLLQCLLWFANAFLLSFSRISTLMDMYFSVPVYLVYLTDGAAFSFWHPLAVLALTALVLWASVALYKRRPIEAAGSMFAFRFAEPIYRALLSFMAATLMCIIFYEGTRSSVLFGLVGAFFGIFLAHIFCQGQFKRSFRGMFSAWKPYAAVAAAFLALFCAFYFDVGGYDSYMPDPAKLKSVSVEGLGYDEGHYYLDQSSFPEESVYTESLNYAIFEDEEVKKLLLEAAAAGVEKYAMEKAGVPSDNSGYGTSFTLRYTMENGRQKQRYYSLPRHAIAEQIKALCSSPAYNEKQPLLNVNAEQLIHVSATGMGGNDSLSARNAAERKALFTALQQDFRAHGKPADAAPVGWVDIEYLHPDGKRSWSITVHVYESYAQSLAILEGWGVNTKISELEAAQKWVRAEIYQNDSSLPMGERLLFETEDPAEMRRIMDSGSLVSNCPSTTLRLPCTVRFYSEEDLRLRAEREAAYIEEQTLYDAKGYAYAAEASYARPAVEAVTEMYGYFNSAEFGVVDNGGLAAYGVSSEQ